MSHRLIESDGFLHWRAKQISMPSFMLVMSMAIGFAAGLAALILRTGVFKMRDWITTDLGIASHTFWIFILPSIGLFITMLIRKFLVNDMGKFGLSGILFAISKRNSILDKHRSFSAIIGAWFTAGFGGSAGLEAPIIISGSSIGSTLGQILGTDYKNTTLLLACGATGAVSAIFNTPIAGVVFALEVLLIDLSRFTLIPLLLASVTGTITTQLLAESEIMFKFEVTEPFNAAALPFYVLLGILAGLVSVYFTRSYIWVESRFDGITNHWKRMALGSVLLGLLIFLFPSLYGEGFNTVKEILEHNGQAYTQMSAGSFSQWQPGVVIFVLLLLILSKPLATSITIGAGGIGGIFAPALFCGAVLGLLFTYTANMLQPFIHLITINFSLVGMSAVLAGVLHAPLTGIFLIAEITQGYELFAPLMLATTISYITVKYFQPHGIITFQLAKKGELITHNKDKAVLNFMNLQELIETDFESVPADGFLRDLVKAVSKSKRNIFPVVDYNGVFRGVVLLDDIRSIMFDPTLYEKVKIRNLIIFPEEVVYIDDNMDTVMNKFNRTTSWNLPILDGSRYLGFLSKSKILSEYRKRLVDMSTE